MINIVYNVKLSFEIILSFSDFAVIRTVVSVHRVFVNCLTIAVPRQPVEKVFFFVFFLFEIKLVVLLVFSTAASKMPKWTKAG